MHRKVGKKVASTDENKLYNSFAPVSIISFLLAFKLAYDTKKAQEGTILSLYICL